MLTRWLIYHIAGGHAYFTGGACLAIAAALSAKPGFRVARNVLAGLGLILAIASATPSPAWVQIALAVATLGWIGAEAFARRLPGRAAADARGVAILAWTVAMLVEGAWHLTPKVPAMGRPVLGIVGDSITAGTEDSGESTWPAILAAEHGVDVRSHAKAGATTALALRQAEAVGPDERLVLLEIGGNDLLGGATAAQFEDGLDRLLSALHRPGRVLVMLELPLPPSYDAFGRAQRRLATRYGARLVPRRVLLGVLQGRDATLDSIHLAADGRRALAEAVWDVIRPAYEGP